MDIKREILKPAPIASAASLAVGMAIGVAASGDTTTVNVYQPALTAHVADRVGVVESGPEPSYVVLGNVDVGPGETVTPGANLAPRTVIVHADLVSPYDITLLGDGAVPGQSFELGSVACLGLGDRTWCEVTARNTGTQTERLVIRARVEPSK